MDEIDLDVILIESLKCPLYPLASELLSPRGIFEAFKLYKEGRLEDNEYLEHIGWCDLCGLCDGVFKSVEKIWIDSFGIGEEDIEIEVVRDGMYHLILPKSLYRLNDFGYLIDFIVDRSRDLGLDVGIATLNVDSFTSLVSSIREDLDEIFRDIGINKVILLDKYTYQKLRGRRGIRIWSLSQLVDSLYSRADIYPVNIPKIHLNILNSIYRFYRHEYKTYLRIISTIPSLEASISKERFGSAFTSFYDRYSSVLAKYIDFKIPPSAYIISTVDPYLYLIVRRYLRKKYVISFTPTLLIGLIRRL